MKAKDYFLYGLGIVIVIGFFGILITLIMYDKYPEQVSLVIGALIGAFLSVVNYNYGSTKGSADKTEMIYNSAKLPDPNTSQITSETKSETITQPATSPDAAQIPTP